jgi:hypothetical protein
LGGWGWGGEQTCHCSKPVTGLTKKDIFTAPLIGSVLDPIFVWQCFWYFKISDKMCVFFLIFLFCCFFLLSFFLSSDDVSVLTCVVTSYNELKCVVGANTAGGYSFKQPTTTKISNLTLTVTNATFHHDGAYECKISPPGNPSLACRLSIIPGNCSILMQRCGQ